MLEATIDSLIATKQAAQHAALSGDDSGRDAAEAAERAALHRHGTLAAASGEAAKMLAFLEDQIATMEDQKLRKATAAEVNALASELVELATAYDVSTRALNEVASRALAVSFELNGLVVFTASSVIEVAAAMPKPAPEPAKVVPPAPVAAPPNPIPKPDDAVFHRVDRPSYQMKFGANN